MTIQELLQAGKVDEAVKLLTSKADVANYSKEYNNARDIRDSQVGKRKNKNISGGSTVVVAKIPIPFQRKIVQSSSVFLFGSPVMISSGINNHQLIIDKWQKLRMDPILLKFAEAVKSETEAAIVFYTVEKDSTVELKSRLLTSKNGELLPYFDEFGDLTAFGWKYKATENGKEYEFLYLFTAEITYVFKNDSGWKDTDQTKPNLFGKIPVVYLSQDNPEWWMVKELIDRFEMNLSKFADTNDYFASPMYKAKGAVTSIPSKDETGKIIKLDIIETDSGKIIEADLDVISWDRAPEALKLEFDTEKDLIYGLTDTPDLSFNNVKGISNVSGIALKLMFLGSILKAKWDEGDYNIAIIRCINVLIAGMVNLTKELSETDVKDAVFKVEFTSILPENIVETVNMLLAANGGKSIISQESAVKNNPIVKDADEEIKLINAETNTEAQSDLFNQTV